MVILLHGYCFYNEEYYQISGLSDHSYHFKIDSMCFEVYK